MLESTSAVIDSKWHSEGRGKNGPSWGVRFITPDGGSGNENLDEDDWELVSTGDTMAYINVPGFPQVSCLGSRPTAQIFSWIFGLFLVLLCTVMVLVVWETKSLGEQKLRDFRGVPLPDPKPSTRRIYSRDT